MVCDLCCVMDNQQSYRLQQLLIAEQHIRDMRYQDSGDVYIIETGQLDEDSGQFYTTKAELEYYGINPQYVSALTNAHWAYDDIIGVADPPSHEGELYNLLCLYREEIDTFTLRHYVDQDFIDFVQRFYDVPKASIDGYIRKRHENRKHPYRYE